MRRENPSATNLGDDVLRDRVKAAQDLRPGTFSVVPYGTSRASLLNPGLPRISCTLLSTRPRMRLSLRKAARGSVTPTKLHRKSGSVLGYSQPSLRDLN